MTERALLSVKLPSSKGGVKWVKLMKCVRGVVGIVTSSPRNLRIGNFSLAGLTLLLLTNTCMGTSIANMPLVGHVCWTKVREVIGWGRSEAGQRRLGQSAT